MTFQPSCGGVFCAKQGGVHDNENRVYDAHMRTYLDDEHQREQREQLQQAKAAQDAQDFASMAASPEGRRWLRRLLEECRIYQSTFTGDALSSAFQEGRRSTGLWVLEQFNHSPELYRQLLEEQQHERTRPHDD